MLKRVRKGPFLLFTGKSRPFALQNFSNSHVKLYGASRRGRYLFATQHKMEENTTLSESIVSKAMTVYGGEIVINTYSGHTREQRYVSEICQLIEKSQHPKPSTLWHYTSADATQSILESNKLRFTHPSSLADPEEVNHSLRFARMILDTLLPTTEDTREKLLMEKINNQMIASNTYSKWFISCFTESCVSDFHWENYASCFSGCCIGFDANELIKFFSRSPSDPPLVLKTIYDTLEMINFGRAVLSFGIRNFEQDYGHLEDVGSAMDRFLYEWGKHVDPTSIMFKREEFREEREWRFGRSIESKTADDQPSIDRYGKRRWDISKGPLSDSTYEYLPIKQIIIGRNSKLTVSDCRTLLEENGFSGVDVLKQG